MHYYLPALFLRRVTQPFLAAALRFKSLEFLDLELELELELEFLDDDECFAPPVVLFTVDHAIRAAFLADAPFFFIPFFDVFCLSFLLVTIG